MRYTRLLTLAVVLLCLPVAPAWGQKKYNLKPGAEGRVCLTCHVTFQEKMNAPSVHTPVKRGECSLCHNPHTSSHGKLLGADIDKMCLACHASLIPQNAGSVHAVVAEGKCMTCHDPHSSPNRANLITAGNKLCFGCHKELGDSVAAAKFKHNPVEKGCLSCHTPHASGKSKSLLKDGVPALCVNCHKTDKPIFAKQHLNYPVASSRCTSCHNPHGSNKAGILFDTVHKPVASKMCNQCHEEPTSPNALKTKKAGFELCQGCHSGLVRETFEKATLHWPVADKTGCQSCHAPHASTYKGLLKGPLSTVCGSCHADTMERMKQAKSQHQPVKEGNCTACHRPHGSDAALLLAKTTLPDLCGTCHDWQSHSSHPIERVMDPRAKNSKVSCLSCHRAHGTENKRLLPFATTSELCVQCHEQYRR